MDSLRLVASEIPEPVGGEFKNALHEMDLGVEMTEALQHTADRIRAPDFDFLVVTLSLQRRTGGALAEALANLSGIVRQRKQLRRKAREVTAEAKASALAIGSRDGLLPDADKPEHDMRRRLDEPGADRRAELSPGKQRQLHFGPHLYAGFIACAQIIDNHGELHGGLDVGARRHGSEPHPRLHADDASDRPAELTRISRGDHIGSSDE
jgi:hypothetical protein